MKTSLFVMAALTWIASFAGQIANAGTVRFSCYVPKVALQTGDDALQSTTADLCLNRGLEKLASAGCEVDPASALPEMKLDGYFKEFQISVVSKNCSNGETKPIASSVAKVTIEALGCEIASTPVVIERDQDQVGPIFQPFTNHICVNAQ